MERKKMVRYANAEVNSLRRAGADVGISVGNPSRGLSGITLYGGAEADALAVKITEEFGMSARTIEVEPCGLGYAYHLPLIEL